MLIQLISSLPSLYRLSSAVKGLRRAVMKALRLLDWWFFV